MNDFVKIQGNDLFILNKDLLGLDEAQLWISKAEGPTDNDDERVKKEREEAKAKGEIYGIEAMDLIASQKYPGWFEVSTINWPVGTYRLIIHSRAGVKAPNGTELQNLRDAEYSWPKISEETIKLLSEEQKKFIYREKNGQGFCFRIKINEDRSMESAGEL